MPGYAERLKDFHEQYICLKSQVFKIEEQMGGVNNSELEKDLNILKFRLSEIHDQLDELVNYYGKDRGILFAELNQLINQFKKSVLKFVPPMNNESMKSRLEL